MMSGLGVIIFIIIIFNVIKGNSGKNNSTSRKQGYGSSTAGYNQPPQSGRNYVRPDGTGSQNKSSAPPQKRNEQRSIAAHSAPRTQQTSAPRRAGAMQKQISQSETAAAQIVQDENESTTEFLNRKAKMDEMAHQKEKLERKRTEGERYGSIVYASRWMDGDPVPASRRLVKCGYCGAENIMPIHDRTKYHCYFCRELL